MQYGCQKVFHAATFLESILHNKRNSTEMGSSKRGSVHDEEYRANNRVKGNPTRGSMKGRDITF